MAKRRTDSEHCRYDASGELSGISWTDDGDPWVDCPRIAFAKRPTRAQAFKAAAEFAGWLFPRFGLELGEVRGVIDGIKASPTVATLFDRPTALPMVLEGLVFARAVQLDEARRERPTGPRTVLANYPDAELRRELARGETLPSNSVDLLRTTLLFRRLDATWRKREARNPRTPLRHLAEAVDASLPRESTRERDRCIVALAREVLGEETTAGRVYELLKPGRRSLKSLTNPGDDALTG